jgi:16S rRNA (guanine1207-N2)-methyltransferase
MQRISIISLFESITPIKHQNHINKLLLLGTEHGAFAEYLVNHLPASNILATDLDVSSLQKTIEIILKNKSDHLQVFPDISDIDSLQNYIKDEDFDTVILLLPKGRKIAQRWLLQAYLSLSNNGSFILIGANDQGIQSVARDASDLFTNIGVLGFKKGTRIYHAKKQNNSNHFPEWAQEPGIAQGTWKIFTADLHGTTYTFHSLPGVFSYDHLDEGTRFLIEHLEIPVGSRVLDIGCGYGAIGIVAANLGAAYVDLADNHLLSIASTNENIHLNKIFNATIYASDLYSSLPDVKYDLILSNPPFHMGKQVDYRVTEKMISEGHKRLNAGGSLIIVANRFIRYERLMQQVFGNFKFVKENKKFAILSSRKL